ncbi:hypothetical protein GCM10010254_32980 [Streptomyces chromofuscus]|nr:hypothetical protein GCM10010254_32980 [Streptomyces chromofuscus]
MRAVPPSRSTTSASQWAGYSCRSDGLCMGPRVRLAYDNGARQSVEGQHRTEAAVRDAPDGTKHPSGQASRYGKLV